MTPGKRLLLWAGMTLAGLGGVAHGQGLGGLGGAGGVGGLAAAPAGFPAAATAAPAAAKAGGSIWGALGLSKANLAACKQKICGSQLGQMLNGGLTPLSAMTGGMIPTFCPTVPSAEQAAALAAAAGPTSAQAVAAKIQQDEAEAKARRGAVRYLSTVDCHYWPEAEAAIIGALRDDRNECVRYEAALALLNGCCCTAKTIEALNIVVAGSEKDGKPSETSERVRGVATAALEGCLLRYHPPAPPIPLERPEPASATRPSPEPVLSPGLRRVAYYYLTLRDVPPALIVAEARRTVERARALATAAPPPLLLTGRRSVYDALARAATPDPAPALAPARPAVEAPALVPTPRQAPAADASETVAPAPPFPAPLPPPAAAPDAPASKPAETKVSAASTANRRGGRNLRDIFLKSTSY